MNSTFALAENSAARYITGSVMYFAQGVPVGLMMIALPAWLVSEGVSAGEIGSFFAVITLPEIGSFFAVITLPWALKLFAGPFMDRYRFLPMGSKRPWVLGAQFGLR
jgi:PAT family beta-lactamase induction signal transducer AmpG